MKIVYMGTPDFSVAPLKALIEAGHTVTAVVTQPDKQKGRGKEVSMTPVKECALSYGIPVLQPVKIKAPEAVEELRKYEADIFVVVAFGQLLSEEILNMPKFGCINLHASLLPKYRGCGTDPVGDFKRGQGDRCHHSADGKGTRYRRYVEPCGRSD